MVHADLTIQQYFEQGVVFGALQNLVGVLSRTDQCDSIRSDSIRIGDSASMGVLLLTPGMLQNSGPFRLHRQICKQLAAQGVPTLRFDLSGIGESLAVGSGGDSLSRAASEISAAIDCLQNEAGVDQVACFGLCSGADDAMYAAGVDDRIIGLYCLDGCGYPTWRFRRRRLLRSYLPKAFSARVWYRKFKAIWGAQETPPSLQLGTDIREFPVLAVAERQLKALAGRGVNMCFHYTGGVRDYYNYEGQFYDMFPSLESESGVSTRFNPEWDHVAFLVEHRQELVAEVTRYFVSLARQHGEKTSRGASHGKSQVTKEHESQEREAPGVSNPPLALPVTSESPTHMA